MKVMMTFLDEDFEKLNKFLVSPLKKGAGGDYVVVHSINGEGPITALKVRSRPDVDAEERTEILFLYDGRAYGDLVRSAFQDHIGYTSSYVDSFEFYHAPDETIYKLTKSYGTVKAELVKIYQYTDKNKEAIDELFRLVKDIEKDDLGKGDEE